MPTLLRSLAGILQQAHKFVHHRLAPRARLASVRGLWHPGLHATLHMFL